MSLPTRFLTIALAMVVALVLAPIAPSGAALDPDHATEYKAKLRYYDSHMDVEIAFTDNWVIATESHAATLAEELGDPERAWQIPLLEAAALSERGLLEDSLEKYWTKLRRDIARFDDKGASWFSKKWERKSFRKYLGGLKSGYEEMWAADRNISAALLALSNSDIAGAHDQLQSARVDAISGEERYDRGVRGLRSLM